MPNVPTQALEEMIAAIPNPDQQQILADIVKGDISHKIYCLSEDIVETQDVPQTDENDQVIYHNVKKHPVAVTKKEKVVVREGCKGRLIGHRYGNGRIVAVKDKEGLMWLRSSRMRFDKVYGFECWCGNDSRLAAQEKGNMDDKNSAPTRDDLEAIWQNINDNPSNYPIVNGRQVIDGFALEEIK